MFVEGKLNFVDDSGEVINVGVISVWVKITPHEKSSEVSLDVEMATNSGDIYNSFKYEKAFLQHYEEEFDLSNGTGSFNFFVRNKDELDRTLGARMVPMPEGYVDDGEEADSFGVIPVIVDDTVTEGLRSTDDEIKIYFYPSELMSSPYDENKAEIYTGKLVGSEIHIVTKYLYDNYSSVQYSVLGEFISLENIIVYEHEIIYRSDNESAYNTTNEQNTIISSIDSKMATTYTNGSIPLLVVVKINTDIETAFNIMNKYVEGEYVSDTKLDSAINELATNGIVRSIGQFAQDINYPTRNYNKYDNEILAWTNFWNEKLKNTTGFITVTPNNIKAMMKVETQIGYVYDNVNNPSANGSIDVMQVLDHRNPPIYRLAIAGPNNRYDRNEGAGYGLPRDGYGLLKKCLTMMSMK